LRLALCEIYELHFGEQSPWTDLPEVSLEADGWNNRGVSYLELGKQEEALRCFARALEANPTHLEATFNQGLLQWRRGQIDDLEVLRRLDRPTTRRAEARSLAIAKAEIHQERSDLEGARECISAYPGLYEELFSPSSSPRIGPLRTLAGHSDEVWSVALSSNGRYALSGAYDNEIRYWDVESGECLQVLRGHSDRVMAVAITHDGCIALSGGADKTVRVWDIATSKCLRVLGGHTDQVKSVALTQDGRFGLSGSLDTKIKVWNIATGECLRTLSGHTQGVSSVALSPDGRCALTGSRDGTVRVWNVATGQCLHALRVNMGFSPVAITPDCRFGLSGSDNVQLWDLSTGQCLRTLDEGQHWINDSKSILSVAINPAGHWGVWSDIDNIRIWDLVRGRCIRSLQENARCSPSIALSDDAHILLSGDETGQVTVWEIGWPKHDVAAFRLCKPRSIATVRAEQDVREDTLNAAERLCEAGNPSMAYRELVVLWKPLGFRFNERIDHLYEELHAKGSATHLLDIVDELLREGEYASILTSSVALTANGHLGLSCDDDDTPIKLWDLRRQRIVRAFGKRADLVTSVAITDDGRLAITGSLNGMLKLWDISDGRCLSTLIACPPGKKSDPPEITSVALALDGRIALSWGPRSPSEY
jgi:WD40 repeat protein